MYYVQDIAKSESEWSWLTETSPSYRITKPKLKVDPFTGVRLARWNGTLLLTKDDQGTLLYPADPLFLVSAAHLTALCFLLS